MSETGQRSSSIAVLLPYLRRYSRALTGSQDSGDAYAVATLEAILEDGSVFDNAPSPKVGVFKMFHSIWTSSGAPIAVDESGLKARAQSHLENLTANTREALLLNTIEDFTFPEIAAIMNIDQAEAEHLIGVARQEMMQSVAGRVMIIEDEPIIAEDLRDIITGLGHEVTGIARTRTEAVALSAKHRPDLIMADIQLADNSSGIDAVNDILRDMSQVPVIFVTAFPERLLTGDKPEPAFLIAKPYRDDQVQSAVSQAMFFASTQTLKV